MRIHISPWIVVGLVVTAVVVSVLASQGWIDVEVFQAVLDFISDAID